MSISLHRVPITLAVAASVATVAGAQVTAVPPAVQQGMAAAWPMAFVVTDNGTTSEVLVKNAVQQVLTGGGTAPAPVATGSPHREALDLLNSHVTAQAGQSATIELDAISSGNAIIGGTGSTGIPHLGNRWLALAVSVASGTPSQAGSHFSQVASQPGGDPGAHLVGYYFNESNGIGTALPGQALVEASRTQLGLPAGGNEDISALDFGIAIHQTSPSGAIQRLFAKDHSLFFSVTESFANEFNNASSNFARNDAGVGVPADPADIYLMRKAPGEDWDGPFLFASAETLGFAPGTNGDIDALDIDLRGTVVFSAKRGNKYLYDRNGSTTGNNVRTMNQLMVVRLDFDPLDNHADALALTETRPLKDNMSPSAAPQLVSYKVGVSVQDPPEPPPTVIPDEDEIDGICVWDPETHVLDTVVGTPAADFGALHKPMSLSTVRISQSGFNLPHEPSLWNLQLSGWGSAQPEDSKVVFYFREGDIDPSVTGTFPTDGWQVLRTVRRRADEDAIHFRYLLPALDPNLDDTTYSIFAAQSGASRLSASSWISSVLVKRN